MQGACKARRGGPRGSATGSSLCLCRHGRPRPMPRLRPPGNRLGSVRRPSGERAAQGERPRERSAGRIEPTSGAQWCGGDPLRRRDHRVPAGRGRALSGRRQDRPRPSARTSSWPSSARPAAASPRCSMWRPACLTPSAGADLVLGTRLDGLNRHGRLPLPAGRGDAVEDGARQCRHRPRGRRRRARPRRWNGRRRWLKRVGLSAFGDRYPHQLSGGQRKRVGLAQVLIRDPQDPADGRAVRAARRADAPDHGQPAARAVGRRPQGRAVRHPRPRGGDRAGRPRGDHVGGAGGAHHRRPCHRPSPPARCLRGATGPALPRAAQGDLGPAPGRGDEGLQRGRRHERTCGRRAKLLVLQALVAVVAIGVWHVGSSVPIGGVYLLPKFFFSTPADVALRVWTLFADGTAKIVNCSEPIDFRRAAQHLRSLLRQDRVAAPARSP